MIKDQIAALQVHTRMPCQIDPISQKATFRDVRQDKSEEARIRAKAGNPADTLPSQVAVEHSAGRTFLHSLAEQMRPVLGWLSSAGMFSVPDGLAKRMIKHERTEAETSLRLLAGGLACFWLALALSPAICFSAWRAVDAARNDGPTSAGEGAIAVAYSHSFDSLLSLQIRLPNLLPSLERLVDIFEDPWAAFTQLIESLANVLQFVNFDPSYFLRSASVLSAVNFLLGLLKLLATYSSKAFALVDACSTLSRCDAKVGVAADKVTLQVHECVAPTEHAIMEALFTRVGVSLDAGKWNFAQQALTDGDMQAVVRGVRLNSGSLASLEALDLSANQIGNEGMIAFADAIKPTDEFPMGSLASLEDLRLWDNTIGDKGMKVFSSALSSGALASLQRIYLGDETMGALHPALKVVCEDRGINWL